MSVRTVNDNILDTLKNGKLDFVPKNPYVKKAQKMAGTLYSTSELLKSFDNLFENNSLPLVIEIGSYMGETLMELAVKNPGINFIGVDIVFKRVVKTAEKIEFSGLKNVKMALGDGLNLVERLPGTSISGCCVFFPDPWEKKKKKRLINEVFLNRVKFILKKKGFLWIKTDHKGYYESYKDTLLKTGFIQQVEKPEMLFETVYPTYFESLFENQNKTIYESIFTSQ